MKIGYLFSAYFSMNWYRNVKILYKNNNRNNSY